MEYVYFPLEKALLENFQSYPDSVKDSVATLEISLNIDGVPLFKSSQSSLWPVLCGIMNLTPVRIFPIALTYGKSKPKNLDFLHDTVRDLNMVLKQGLSCGSKVLKVSLRPRHKFHWWKKQIDNSTRKPRHDAIKGFLSNKGCDWIKFTMNVPSASLMGGAWERLIRTVCSVLSTLLFNHGTQLDDDSLRTLMTESMVNNRPLTVCSLSEPGMLEPLMPNHLLTCKSEIILQPPGDFTRPDLYSCKRWRRVQYLTNQFWQRWRKEYSNMLQCEKKKCTRQRRNSRVGDIVIVRDDDLARNNWPLGKVVEVDPSDDDLVRKVRILVSHGSKLSHLDRPVHKLVLIIAQDGEKENI
ncbi:Hypothetical predicted protein [Paramuricea clavata]|uniref:Uncharacterized protein n=1 Tax=Paramuricea clavata TaxID=317549 RepID=A0A6S7KIH3_PARCT|nr:Hypothetical predicted protein [Paramuricea clavata]